MQGKLAQHNAIWDMGCRNDQHEHCDFDLDDGKDSISLDTNLMTLFQHTPMPLVFLSTPWLFLSSSFAFEAGRCSQTSIFREVSIGH